MSLCVNKVADKRERERGDKQYVFGGFTTQKDVHSGPDAEADQAFSLRGIKGIVFCRGHVINL